MITVEVARMMQCRACGRTWPYSHGQIDTVAHEGTWGHEKITGEFCSGTWWPVDVVEFWCQSPAPLIG